MQGEIQYPPHIDAPNYNAAHYGQYHPLPLHVSDSYCMICLLSDDGTHMFRIEPGPGGRFEVWIALELADIF
jgi:hypothetical protein